MTEELTPGSGTVLLHGENLSLEAVCAVAREFKIAALAPDTIAPMTKSRELVERWVQEGEIIYGITTGFGSLQSVVIPPEDVEQLQENIILSHSAGVGEPMPEEVVRAMVLLRANALAKGYSGIRVEVVERLLQMLNKRICPVVPAKGSVGSSGNLAPLAHITSVMIGAGEAFYQGERLPGMEALKRAGVEPVRLQAKEGLALTNGTQFMSAIGVLALLDSERLAKTADIAGAMSLEAMKGKSAAFLDAVQQLRPFEGQIISARNIRAMIIGSELIDCVDKDTEGKRQDAYSLRCMPQVHGASRQAIAFVRQMLLTEINSATDNPLIIADPRPLTAANAGTDDVTSGFSYSAGNFHGQPIALSMDFLSLALSEIGNISERRVARLMSDNENYGLNCYLVKQAGLNSGMMIAQYTAAALVSENKVLIHPASGDSIPTSANQEDHNSMGSIAARQAREVLENVERIIAIELLCAAQALGLRELEAKKLGAGTSAAYSSIRQRVGQMVKDRELYIDIQKVLDLVRSSELIREVDNALQEYDSDLQPLG